MKARETVAGGAPLESAVQEAPAAESLSEAPASFPDLDTERRFWDEHDTGPLGGFDVVEDRGSPREGFSHVLSVRLDRQTFRALAAAARRVGIGPSTLLRMWALEQLRAEAQPAGDSGGR